MSVLVAPPVLTRVTEWLTSAPFPASPGLCFSFPTSQTTGRNSDHQSAPPAVGTIGPGHFGSRVQGAELLSPGLARAGCLFSLSAWDTQKPIWPLSVDMLGEIVLISPQFSFDQSRGNLRFPLSLPLRQRAQGLPPDTSRSSGATCQVPRRGTSFSSPAGVSSHLAGSLGVITVPGTDSSALVVYKVLFSLMLCAQTP